MFLSNDPAYKHMLPIIVEETKTVLRCLRIYKEWNKGKAYYHKSIGHIICIYVGFMLANDSPWGKFKLDLSPKK